MNPETERLIGDILIALVKAAETNELTLTADDLIKDPNEVVFINNNSDGSFTLKVKNVTTIEGV